MERVLERARADTGRLTLGATALLLIGVAAACWVTTAQRLQGMDMSPSIELGGLGWFAVTWALMMAAMMLPSLVPAAWVSRGAATFTAGYLALWTVAGLVAWAVVDGVRSEHIGWLAWDRAGRWLAAAALLAAAAYQLSAAKGDCLDRCRAPDSRGGLRGGARHGLSCVGCCAGLMVALFALGVMSLTWMVAVAALIAAERLLPWHAPAVHGVAVTLGALAVWMAVAPGGVPG